MTNFQYLSTILNLYKYCQFIYFLQGKQKEVLPFYFVFVTLFILNNCD